MASNSATEPKQWLLISKNGNNVTLQLSPLKTSSQLFCPGPAIYSEAPSPVL